MIEEILRPKTVWHHPIVMLLLAFFSVSIAILLGWKMFPESSSMLIITLTIIPVLPVMVKIIEYEEDQLEHHHKLFKRNKIITIYAWFFIGLVFSFFIWAALLPQPTSQALFSEQYNAMYDFRGPTGFAIAEHYWPQGGCPSNLPVQGEKCEAVDFNKDNIAEYIVYQNGKASLAVKPNFENDQFVGYTTTSYKYFLTKHILANNFVVLVLALITSFIFGAGAVFILTWNASIIGIYLANAMTQNQFIASFGDIVVHGVPEVLSFILAAIAGGILSVCILRNSYTDKRSLLIYKDAFIFVMLALVLLFVAALLEVLV